jgi:hypothetical protein
MTNNRRRETEKVIRMIVPLKNAHDFSHSSLEEREMMVTRPEKPFSIVN